MHNHLATGITGTIGRHLPKETLRISCDLVDVSKTLDTSQFPKNSVVTHLAGIVGPDLVANDLHFSHKVNVQGTLALAEKFLEHSIKRFIYISSSHVYSTTIELITESSKLDPQNLYAEQKLKAEDELQKLFQNSGAELVILRVFSVLDWDVADFTLGGLFRKIALGDRNIRIKNGDDIRDFLTPKTIAESIEKVAACESISGILNLCSGSPTSVRDAALRMLNHLGTDHVRNIIDKGNSNVPRIVGNPSKFLLKFKIDALEWKPGVYSEK